MPISAVERAAMMKAHSIGPKMVSMLERIGIERLCDLEGADAGELALRINCALGHPHINAQGVRALENLIALAGTDRR